MHVRRLWKDRELTLARNQGLIVGNVVLRDEVQVVKKANQVLKDKNAVLAKEIAVEVEAVKERTTEAKVRTEEIEGLKTMMTTICATHVVPPRLAALIKSWGPKAKRKSRSKKNVL